MNHPNKRQMYYVHLIFSSDKILQYYQNQKLRIVCTERNVALPTIAILATDCNTNVQNFEA